MFEKLKNKLAPPRFEDQEKTDIAYYLNIINIVIILSLGHLALD